jgi:predicted metal-dependent HD superfamily phosphohydrolase
VNKTQLLPIWQHTLAVSGLNPSLHPNLLEEIIAAYSEPHRFYHTAQHLLQLFSALNQAGCNDEAVLWAAWYHDFTYIPTKTNNEKVSAQKAVQCLQSMGLSTKLISQVQLFIEATKTHKTQDALCQLFLDADMSILGAASVDYEVYAQKVKQEFSAVIPFLFRRGRRHFLVALLKSPRIFKTDYFHAHYEKSARANMYWELTTLLA